MQQMPVKVGMYRQKGMNRHTTITKTFSVKYFMSMKLFVKFLHLKKMIKYWF